MTPPRCLKIAAVPQGIAKRGLEHCASSPLLFIGHGRRVGAREAQEASPTSSASRMQCHAVTPMAHSGSQTQPHTLTPSMKETQCRVLTRTQMQRETQSSECGCSHLPVQVVTGVLEVGEEGDRAGELGQLLSGQGGEPAVLKGTGGTETQGRPLWGWASRHVPEYL